MMAQAFLKGGKKCITYRSLNYYPQNKQERKTSSNSPEGLSGRLVQRGGGVVVVNTQKITTQCFLVGFVLVGICVLTHDASIRAE